MSQFQLIIFDCDGVIVDSEPLAAAVISELAAAYGLQISPDEAEERFNGRHIGKWIKELEHELQRSIADQFVPEFRQRSAEKFRNELRPIPGIIEVLDQLETDFCLASSGPLEKIQTTLGTTGLLQRFTGRIFSGYELKTWKPDPDLFLHAAEHFNIAPNQCAVIEDSHPGVEAGIAAGMTVFHYNPQKKSGFPQSSRVHPFSAMNQLLDLLKTKL